MSKNAYILEAFKQFDSLMEEEELDVIEREEMPITGVDTEKMHDFLDTVGDDSDIDIIDLEAEAEDELKQSYIGSIILDCNVCHSNIFINKDEVSVNEDGVANLETECPYCMSNEGYTIIGEVQPYSEFEEEEVPEETDIESEPIDDIESEEGLEESMKLDGIKKLRGRKKLYRRDDKDGVKAIRGRNNSEISGTDDLRESCKNCDDVDEGLITKDEYDDKMEMVGRDAANHKIGDNEFEYAQDVLKQELDECGDTEKLEECGDEPLKEAIEDDIVTIGVYGSEEDLIDKYGSSDKFEYTCKNKGIKVAGGIDDVDGEYDYELTGPGFEIYKIMRDMPGYNNMNLSPSAWIEQYRLDESCNKKNKIKESIEDVTINTEDENITMTTKEDGGVVVETSPNTEEIADDFIEEPVESEETFEPGDEVIGDISDDDVDEIELNSEVDTLEDEDIDALDEPDEFDADEFDEESFDTLGESYLRRQYDNVEGFKTVNAKVFNNSLIVEGVIRFNSGASKGTSFVFEAAKMKNNKVMFEGYNTQISRGKKTFKLNCSLNKGCIKPKKMSYNYRAKNELNESVRVNGTVRVK